MRILVASDLHYRLPHYGWLVEQALHFDVIALPGDHLDGPGDHGEQIPSWLRQAAGQRIHVDNDVVDIGTTRLRCARGATGR
ncbi:MAG TPA: hypothetical protein VM282_12610 [Acidimicrobiales bacterium]|nr:hypothetical protein [Acidimicrobiales bacterium]